MLPGKLLKEMGVVQSAPRRGLRRERRGGRGGREGRGGAEGRGERGERGGRGERGERGGRDGVRGDRGHSEKVEATEKRKLEEDPELEIQRRLAKQLGIKAGKMKKEEDGLDDLLDELDEVMMGDGSSSLSQSDGDLGTSDGSDGASPSSSLQSSLSGSSYESEEQDEDARSSSFDFGSSEEGSEEREDEDQGASPSPPAAAASKYIPPALRRAQQEQGTVDKAETAVMRKVRGLINRMTESNLEGIVAELAVLYRNEGRSYVSTSLSSELITSSTEGPRASERFAITAAAAIASLAALTESPEVIATFLSLLGRQLEASLIAKDTLASSNLVRVLGCLYLSKAIKPDLVFDVLNAWTDAAGAFTDEHVVSIAGLLTVAGLALRKADPTRMKDFVVDIHEKASRMTGDQLTTRARVMLDLVVDVKNNRMKDRNGMLAISANSSATLANALPPNVAPWFRGSISKIEAVAIGGIPWAKVVRGDNKGFWWLQGARDVPKTSHGSNKIPQENEQGTHYDAVGADNAQLLKLARKLRMSTDTRRAIFLAVMSSEDAVDAAEKLLRLNLKGSQEREIVRVTVECCMHEPAWNPYYGLLLTRLCTLAKGHRVTLNYCLWDFIKDLRSPSPTRDGPIKLKNGRQIAIFSRLCAHVVVHKALPLASVIKVQSELDSIQMDTRELLMWKTLFKNVCALPKTDDDMKDIFSRLGMAKEHKALRRHLRQFLKYHVGPWLIEKGEDDVALRCSLAETCLRV